MQQEVRATTKGSTTLTKNEILQTLKDRISPVVEEIDFRQAALDFAMPKTRREVKSAIKEKLLKVIKAGGVALFNIDDSPCKYDMHYDPDYNEFYDRRAMHQHIWDPDKLLHKEVWTQYSGTETLPQKQYTVSTNSPKSSVDRCLVQGTHRSRR